MNFAGVRSSSLSIELMIASIPYSFSPWSAIHFLAHSSVTRSPSHSVPVQCGQSLHSSYRHSRSLICLSSLFDYTTIISHQTPTCQDTIYPISARLFMGGIQLVFILFHHSESYRSFEIHLPWHRICHVVRVLFLRYLTACQPFVCPI